MWWMRAPTELTAVGGRNVTQKSFLVCQEQKTDKRSLKIPSLKDKMPTRKIKNCVRKGLTLGHFLRLMWLLLFCFGRIPPNGPPGFPFWGSFGGMVPGALVAHRTCPLGTPGFSRNSLAWSSHGGKPGAQRPSAAQKPLQDLQDMLDVDLSAHSFIMCLVWLFSANPSFTIFTQKPSRRARKKFTKPKNRHVSRRWAGTCRWIGKRRHKVVNKRYRLLGKHAAWIRLKAIRNARLTRRSAFCVTGKSSQQIASTASRGLMGCSRFWFLLGTILNHPVVQFGRLWFSGNRQYSLGTTVFNFICKLGNWNPWNAQRVGEASNPGPGPGGSRSTERKRKEQTASQEADVSLATELLHVMEKFQSRADEQGISAPPKKKGKGGNLVPQPKSNLATSLMQILQSALDNSWSGQEIIQRMQSKLTKVIAGNLPMDSNESKTRRSPLLTQNSFLLCLLVRSAGFDLRILIPIAF